MTEGDPQNIHPKSNKLPTYIGLPSPSLIDAEQNRDKVLKSINESISNISKLTLTKTYVVLDKGMRLLVKIGRKLLVFVFSTIANIWKFIGENIMKGDKKMSEMARMYDVKQDMNTPFVPANVSFVSRAIAINTARAGKSAFRVLFPSGGYVDTCFSFIASLISCIFKGLIMTTGINVIIGTWSISDVYEKIQEMGYLAVTQVVDVGASAISSIGSLILAHPFATIFISVLFAIIYFIRRRDTTFKLGVTTLVLIMKFMKHVFIALDKLVKGIINIITRLYNINIKKISVTDIFPALVGFVTDILYSIRDSFIDAALDILPVLFSLFSTILNVGYDILTILVSPIQFVYNLRHGMPKREEKTKTETTSTTNTNTTSTDSGGTTYINREGEVTKLSNESSRGFDFTMEGKFLLSSKNRFRIEPTPGDYIQGSTLILGREGNNTSTYSSLYGLYSGNKTVIDTIELEPRKYNLTGNIDKPESEMEVDRNKSLLPYKVGSTTVYPKRRNVKKTRDMSDDVPPKIKTEIELDEYFKKAKLVGGPTLLSVFDEQDAENLFNTFLNSMISIIKEIDRPSEMKSEVSDHNEEQMEISKSVETQEISNEELKEDIAVNQDMADAATVIQNQLLDILSQNISPNEHVSTTPVISKSKTKETPREYTDEEIGTLDDEELMRYLTRASEVSKEKDRADQDGDVEMGSTNDSFSKPNSNTEISTENKIALEELAVIMKQNGGFNEAIDKLKKGNLIPEVSKKVDVANLSVKSETAPGYLSSISSYIGTYLDRESNQLTRVNHYRNLEKELLRVNDINVSLIGFYEQKMQTCFFYDLSSYKYTSKRAYKSMVHTLDQSKLFIGTGILQLRHPPTMTTTSSTMNTITTTTTTTTQTDKLQEITTTTTLPKADTSSTLSITNNWYAAVCWKLFSHLLLMSYFKLLAITDTYSDDKIKLKYSVLNTGLSSMNTSIDNFNTDGRNLDMLSQNTKREYQVNNPVSNQTIMFKSGIVAIRFEKNQYRELHLDKKLEILYSLINNGDKQVSEETSKGIQYEWMDSSGLSEKASLDTPDEEQKKNDAPYKDHESIVYNQYTRQHEIPLSLIDEIQNKTQSKKVTRTITSESIVENMKLYIPKININTMQTDDSENYEDYTPKPEKRADVYLENPQPLTPGVDSKNWKNNYLYSFFFNNGGFHTVIQKDFFLCNEFIYDTDALDQLKKLKDDYLGNIKSLLNQKRNILEKIKISDEGRQFSRSDEQKNLLKNVNASIENLRKRLRTSRVIDYSNLSLLYVLTLYFPAMGLDKTINLCLNSLQYDQKTRMSDIGLEYEVGKSRLSGDIHTPDLPNMYKLCIVLKNYKKGERYTIKEIKNCFVSIEVGNKVKLLRTTAYLQPYSLYQFLIEHNLVNINHVLFVPILNPNSKEEIMRNSMAKMSRLISIIWNQKYEMMEYLQKLILWSNFKRNSADEKIENLKRQFVVGIGYFDNMLNRLLTFINPLDTTEEITNEEQAKSFSKIVEQIETQFNSYLLHRRIL